MSTNISKQKRKDLSDKIKAIHKYIAGAKQDENTRNLLAWFSEIEKEISHFNSDKIIRMSATPKGYKDTIVIGVAEKTVTSQRWIRQKG
jgi:hypothetical protein